MQVHSLPKLVIEQKPILKCHSHILLVGISTSKGRDSRQKRSGMTEKKGFRSSTNLFLFLFIIQILTYNFNLYAQGEDDFSTFNFADNITNVGTSAAAFLEIGIGARAQSMGGAFTAIVNDATALYWNPAGISRLPAISITANHSNWLADTKLQFFGVVIPFSNNIEKGMTTPKN
jgi:hypothetical protein